MSTGELVVNVLDAIGINFDWARGGTLTLGGYGNGNGLLSILDSLNTEKVHGDNTGITIGGTTGSKIKLTTEGELLYYYDNVYQGKIRMTTHSYTTIDTLEIQDFNAISLVTANTKARMRLAEEDGDGIATVSTDDQIKINAPDIQLGMDIGNKTNVGDLSLHGTVTIGNDTGQNADIYAVNKFGGVEHLRYVNGVLVEDTAQSEDYVTYSTTDITAGTTPLATGSIYLVYE